jgi:hypothetical protein
MLLLVSGATTYPRGDAVGHLIVPRQWNDPDVLQLQPGRWAMDNGCFMGLDVGAYLRMLYAFRQQPGCLFVTAPDAVGDAAETRYLWQFWAPIIRATGHTPAFVAQDGLQPDQVPWHDGIALFIGGTTKFKESQLAQSLIAMAKAKGIWTHVGRVNGKRRYEMMLQAGVDSIDGTGFSMYPDINIPKVEAWRDEIRQQPTLIEIVSEEQLERS